MKTTIAATAVLMLLFGTGAGYAQTGTLGSSSSQVMNAFGRPMGGVNVAICEPLPTTGAQVTSNVAVLTMAGNPIAAGFAPGMQIQVAGFSGADTYFNGGSFANGTGITGGYTILSVTSTTITYSLTHANASASSNGTVLQQGNATTSCAGLATVYSDAANQNAITQPIATDGLGNWQAFTPTTGLYYVQFYGSTVTTQFRQVTALSSSNLNNIIYVDGVKYSQSDIGAGTNSAVSALPSTGGRIHWPARTGGGCYSTATPIPFTTLSQLITPDGDNDNATCENYTPTTATNAITLDWTPNTGGGYLAGAGLRDLSLSNNGCVTNGGCGSSAIGINVGPTNGGAHSSLFSNLRLSGFGTGMKITDAGGASASWGMLGFGFNCSWNTTCYSQSVNEEAQTLFGSKMAVNGTALNFANGITTDFYDIGGSIDSNTSCGVQTNSSVVQYHAFAKHFENLNVSGNVHYMCGGSASLGLFGGQILDDNTTGSSSTDAFVASNVMAFGPTVFSGGQTFSGHVFTVNGVADIHVLDNSPSVIPQSSIAFCGNGAVITVVAPGNQPYICYGGAITAGGNTPTLSGTGACATITTQVGGSWSGTFKCTGTTGTSTVAITPGSTAPNGWNCSGSSDETAGTIMAQSAHTTTSCTIKGTVNTNDVIVFTANKF